MILRTGKHLIKIPFSPGCTREQKLSKRPHTLGNLITSMVTSDFCSTDSSRVRRPKQPLGVK